MKTKTVLSFLGVLSLATACAASPLPPAPGDGFYPLFNGVNFAGWMTTAGHARDWRVENGEMVVSGRSPEAARELRTARKYGDFELRFEFMVSEGGNSGLFFRMGETDAGLEIQLLDDYAPRHSDLRDWQYSGALYGMAGPSQRVSGKAGEWQNMIVRLQGQELSVVLNGVEIVDANLDEFAADESATRWHEFLRRTDGYLGFQNYGNETRFRNVWILSLQAENSPE